MSITQEQIDYFIDCVKANALDQPEHNWHFLIHPSMYHAVEMCLN